MNYNLVSRFQIENAFLIIENNQVWKKITLLIDLLYMSVYYNYNFNTNSINKAKAWVFNNAHFKQNYELICIYNMF